MQNPNEDTQWNDALRKHGILPEKEVSEEDVIDLVEQTVKQKTSVVKNYEDMTLDELDAMEDDEDERVLLQYRYGSKNAANTAGGSRAETRHFYTNVRRLTCVPYLAS